MARKTRRPVPNVPYADALAWCGEAALRAVSTAQMRTNWKDAERGGVPWYIVGPLLRARATHPAQPLPSSAPARSSKSDREADHVPKHVRIAEAQVRMLWFKTNKRHPERWQDFQNYLNTLVSPDEVAQTLPDGPIPGTVPAARKRADGKP